MRDRRTLLIIVGFALSIAGTRAPAQVPAPAQGPPSQGRGGRAGGPRVLPGPSPSHVDLEYAPADPAGSNGHKLDLYIPTGASGPLPVVIWTGGSAWMADTGKRTAPGLAAQLNPAGYAVAGVSIRSTSQVQFPGQLHDIKAAIRFLRANAQKYNLDAEHIGIMGDSSGGWTAAMAAVTGDVPELEGSVGRPGCRAPCRQRWHFTRRPIFSPWMRGHCASARCRVVTTMRRLRSLVWWAAPFRPVLTECGPQAP